MPGSGRAHVCEGEHEQVELLDDESERDDGDAGAHPGEKGSLVGRMITIAADHGTPRFPIAMWLQLSPGRRARRSGHLWVPLLAGRARAASRASSGHCRKATCRPTRPAKPGP